ncbi:unnamed protein product [Discula destructiva]
MAKTQGQKRRREAEADLEHKTAAAIAGKDGAPPSKKSRVEDRRSLFVRSLPASATSESLTEYFSQHYPIKHATVVVDKNTKASRGYGFVTFTDADDAVEAKKKLNNEMFDGRKLRLDVAEPRQRAGTGGGAVKHEMAAEKKRREEEMAEARKAPKLIIRNLPWSIKKEDHLSKLFMKYGKIKFTDLPQDKGLLKGFGFITFKTRKHAERALAEMNGKDVDGRTIAVDWAVSKDEWQQQQDVAEEKEEKKPKTNKVKKDTAEKEDKEMSEADRDLASFMEKMEDFDSEEDDDKADSDDDEGDEEEDADDEEGGGALDGEDKEDGESSDEEADLEDEAAKVLAQKPKRTTDNSTTVFIRNLPFTSTDESLKEHFTPFGPVRYARVVMNKAIDKPAGTAFVCFYNVDDFKACVKSAPRQQPAAAKTAKHSVLQDETIDSDGRYTIDGRVLQVTSAVSKEEAAKLTEAGPAARKTQDKDKRRLYLLSEGTIPKNSPLYDLLTPTEIKLRDQSAQQRKKQVMSNPSLHLSTIRLAIRNLPRNIDSKELKQLARQAIVGFATDVREGRREELSKEEQARGGDEDRAAEAKRKDKGVGVVKQAKIVYETGDGKKVKEETGAGKSRGYGFIEYWSHRWALMGLRWLNGHPLKNEAGKTVRLIVEFAIENQQVVSRRKANEARSRQIQAEIANGTRKPGEKDDDKKAAAAADGKGKKKGKKGQKDAEAAKKEEVVEVSDDEATKSKKKDAAEKLAQRQRIIGRKRMARKSKVGGRRGK